jgi:hypothetical protein
VRFFGAFGSVNSGQDPRERIAHRLTEIEHAEGFDKLGSALRAIFEM